MILSWYEDNWRDRTDGFSLSKYSGYIFHAEKTLNAGILKAMIFFMRMNSPLRAFLPKKADS